jgi:ATP-binding cassette subfamily B protein
MTLDTQAQTQKHSRTDRLRYLVRAARLIYTAAPRWTVAWAIMLVLQGLIPVAGVALTRLLVDSLVAGIASGSTWEQLQPALLIAALLAGIFLLTEILQAASGWVRAGQAELLQDYISKLIHAQSVRLDLSYYESPEYHDRLHRVTSDANSRPLVFLENAGSLLQNGLTLAGIALLLAAYGAWLPILLVASALPVLVVVLRHNRHFHAWWERATQSRRWIQYFDAMLTHPQAAAELRLFDLGGYFRAAFMRQRREVRLERMALVRSQSLARLGAGATSLVIAGGLLAWMFWRVLQGALSLGDLTLFYQAFSRGQGLLRAGLDNLGQIYTSSLFLGNMFEYLALEPKISEPPTPVTPPSELKQGIRFRKVRFQYPGSERHALDGLDLYLPASQITAIVGPNGAGKSTLVKLLCRFYEPQGGAVELDGIDIRSFNSGELRQLMTVLFQAPMPYHGTAAENIALGDLFSQPDRLDVERAARAAGAHEVISRLPHGYDTLLGKWFADGEELSAGEWQRLALARAYLRRAPILILDEPTSFMDSWAEADWFERLRELASGRTVLMITHRFTIAMRADIIHVMQSGRVIESGNHEQLLAQEGLYARSWADQMRVVPELAA